MREDDPRVLLVLAESAGGIGRHVRMLATDLPARGIAVSVCAPATTVAELGLDRLGVPVTTAPVGRRSPSARRQARAGLRAAGHGVDIIHAHGLRAAADCAWFVGDRPLVTTWHNGPPGAATDRAGYAVLSRYVASRAAVTLTASPDLAALAVRRGARSVGDVFVVAPPLSPPTRGRVATRADLEVAPEQMMVLAIGRLTRQKRLQDLVAAAAGWAGTPDAPLVVVAGDGPARAGLSAAIRAAGAPVRLIGARTDVSDLLAAADVVALPSQWEARALVAQEALRTGVPLVAAAVGGLPDLVGEAAVLVPVGDVAALRRALVSLREAPDERRRLAEAGRVQAAGWPGTDQMVSDLVKIYLTLVSR